MVSTLESPPVRMARHAARRLPEIPPGTGHSPLLTLLPLLLFGLMGLYLPQGMPGNKLPRLSHTLGQIALVSIASATVFNGGRFFPFVYLVLVIRSCLMFGLTGRIVMTVVTFVLFVTGLQFRLRSISGIGRRLPPPVQRRLTHLVMGLQLNFVVLFGLSLLLVVLLINALLTERQSQQRLRQANRELRASAHKIEKLAMDQERSRIARDIHDALGHSLTALNIQLESAVKLSEKDPPRSHHFLKAAKRLGSQSLQDVRTSVAALQHDSLNGKSLEQAIAHLLQDLQNNAASMIITNNIQLNQPLPANLNAILYRIVQEGLTNIVKHAEATHVHLQLTDQLTDQQINATQTVTLSLEDDGKGFHPQQASTGFGLQSMRDRAEAANGTFSIVSPIATSQGTKIQVNLPVLNLSHDQNSLS